MTVEVKVYDVVRALHLRGTWSGYMQAIQMADEDGTFAKAGINTPLRVCHFLSQYIHESGALRVKRESMYYSASRIMQIFGVGKHSAAIRKEEASTLAKNPEALASRVYGLGNPSKAKALGNTRPGDGYLFRGGGLPQVTGGAGYKELSGKIGADFYSNPDLVADAKFAIKVAIYYWNKINGNKLADKNDSRTLTHNLNGGYNGYDDRMNWFNKCWDIVNNGQEEAVATAAWKSASTDSKIKKLQKDLNSLGIRPELKEDGLMGPSTEKNVRVFQQKNKLKVDGIPGPVTLQMIKLRLNTMQTPTGTVDKPKTPIHETATKTGGGLVAFGVFGQELIDKVQQVRDLVGDNPQLQFILGVAAVIGLGLFVYGWYQKHYGVLKPQHHSN